MGWLSDKLFGKRKSIDQNHIKNLMKPTQDLVNEQLNLSRDLMDPDSAMSQQHLGFLQSQAGESAAQASTAVNKIAAMRNVSPAQAMMHARIASNKAYGNVTANMQNYLQDQFGMGLGLMGNMTQMQQGLNDNQANAYVQQVNAANAKRASRVGMFTSLLGAAVTGATMGAAAGAAPAAAAPTSDIALKENIELVGKSPKGVNIYEFDYKDKSYGKGRYKGVMAQEVPNASFKGYDGYLRVNYDKLDVNFERIG